MVALREFGEWWRESKFFEQGNTPGSEPLIANGWVGIRTCGATANSILERKRRFEIGAKSVAVFK